MKYGLHSTGLRLFRSTENFGVDEASRITVFGKILTDFPFSLGCSMGNCEFDLLPPLFSMTALIICSIKESSWTPCRCL